MGKEKKRLKESVKKLANRMGVRKKLVVSEEWRRKRNLEDGRKRKGL